MVGEGASLSSPFRRTLLDRSSEQLPMTAFLFRFSSVIVLACETRQQSTVKCRKGRERVRILREYSASMPRCITHSAMRKCALAFDRVVVAQEPFSCTTIVIEMHLVVTIAFNGRPQGGNQHIPPCHVYTRKGSCLQVFQLEDALQASP